MPRRNLIVIVLVGVVSGLCWQNGHAARPKDDTMELYGLFVDAVEQVETNYVRPVPRKELLEGALKGMLQGLDQHSTYLNQADWKQFQKQLEGSFSGIGVQLDVDPETAHLKVLAPIVGSPAYDAGILAGDHILEVDGKPTDGITSTRAQEVLQGRPGTSVELTVVHPGTEKPEHYSVRRAMIELPSVLGDQRKPDDTWDWMLDKDRKIGYIRIATFIQNTTEDLKKALNELKAQGVQGLVIDLRNNPGGLLTSAVEVSDLFLESGLIVTTKGRNTKDVVYEAEKDGTFPNVPLAVIVNEHSASAAEIVSAALQDHKRATIVGQRSYGKGSVQKIISLDDGDSVLKLTVATYWRPSGKDIHRYKNSKKGDWGVSPDPGAAVELSPEDEEKWSYARRDRDLLSSRNKPKPGAGDKGLVLPEGDTVLNRALAIVKEKLAGGEQARK